MAFVFQVIGGIGNGISTTSTLAILSSYKEQRQEYIGYFEIISGVGTLLGPIIGAGLYEIGGFQAPFFGIGALNMAMLLSVKCCCRNMRQKEVTEVKISSDSLVRENSQTIYEPEGKKHHLTLA